MYIYISINCIHFVGNRHTEKKHLNNVFFISLYNNNKGIMKYSFLIVSIYLFFLCLCIDHKNDVNGYADDEDPWATNGPVKVTKSHNYGSKMFIEDDPDILNARNSIASKGANGRANIWVATRESDNVKLTSLNKVHADFNKGYEEYQTHDKNEGIHHSLISPSTLKTSDDGDDSNNDDDNAIRRKIDKLKVEKDKHNQLADNAHGHSTQYLNEQGMPESALATAEGIEEREKAKEVQVEIDELTKEEKAINDRREQKKAMELAKSSVFSSGGSSSSSTSSGNIVSPLQLAKRIGSMGVASNGLADASIASQVAQNMNASKSSDAKNLTNLDKNNTDKLANNAMKATTTSAPDNGETAAPPPKQEVKKSSSPPDMKCCPCGMQPISWRYPDVLGSRILDGMKHIKGKKPKAPDEYKWDQKPLPEKLNPVATKHFKRACCVCKKALPKSPKKKKPPKSPKKKKPPKKKKKPEETTTPHPRDEKIKSPFNSKQ